MRTKSRQTLATHIREIAAYSREYVDKYRVIFLADIKERTKPIDDYEFQSITTEFYFLADINEIISAIRSIGFETSISFDILDTCSEILQKPKSELDSLIIFSIAQNGTGPGRKAIMPALCQLLGAANTMGNPHAESLARHKWHSASILRQWGISIPQTWCFDAAHGWLQGISPTPGTPVIAKASFECGSIGVTAETTGLFSKEMESKLSFLSEELRQTMTIQEFIRGREIEVGVLIFDQIYPLLPVMIESAQPGEPDAAYLDYDAVRIDNYGFRDFTEIEPDLAQEARQTAAKAAEILGFSGLCRIDMRVSRSGPAYVTDVSSCPDYRPNGSIAFGARIIDVDYEDLIALPIASAIRRQELNRRSRSGYR